MMRFALASGLFCAVLSMGTARADYVFSGAGTSGTLTGGGESWSFNSDFQFGGITPDWGSPGVDASYTSYVQTSPAYGFTVNFTGGGTIDADFIAIGNASACAGSTSGGTTFCTATNDLWQAIQVGPDTIDFLAQNPKFEVTTGEPYFVNVFFAGATPTGFTGSWLTNFAPTPPNPVVTPEPSSLLLLGSGLLGVCSTRFLRRK